MARTHLRSHITWPYASQTMWCERSDLKCVLGVFTLLLRAVHTVSGQIISSVWCGRGQDQHSDSMVLTVKQDGQSDEVGLQDRVL